MTYWDDNSDYWQEYTGQDDYYSYEEESMFTEEECETTWECQDFVECDSDLKNFDDEYCYVEECWNVCEDTYCNIFRTDDTQYNQYDGTYYWTTEECPVDENAEQFEAVSEQASIIAEGFEDTFMTALNEYCPNGSCVQEVVTEAVTNSTAADSIQSAIVPTAEISQFVNTTLTDKNVNIANVAIEDAEKLFGLDLAIASEVVNTKDEQVVVAVVQQA